MTFLRWAGSKKQILETLSHAWYASSKTGRYIEAFSGSAALFFYLKPVHGILIDCNKDLQECMQMVKERPMAIATILQKFRGTEIEYYTVRGEDTTQMTPVQRAARFIYLNRYCFNGLYRTNSKGKFNVPFGGARAGTLPDHKKLVDQSEILKAAEIVCGDFFQEVENRIQPGDFVYLDPPYAKRNKTLDFQYGPDEFGLQDLIRLKELTNRIDSAGASFVVSYADCEEVEEIGLQWNTFKVQVNRTIAASSKKRGHAQEILISNI